MINALNKNAKTYLKEVEKDIQTLAEKCLIMYNQSYIEGKTDYLFSELEKRKLDKVYEALSEIDV